MRAHGIGEHQHGVEFRGFVDDIDDKVYEEAKLEVEESAEAS